MVSITVKNHGYVLCRSERYFAHDCLRGYHDCLRKPEEEYKFGVGVNKLIGEIDSGCWAISYLLSMYSFRPKDFILFSPAEIEADNITMPLKKFGDFSCYMDKLYPLFNSRRTVSALVKRGIKNKGLHFSADKIRDIFLIDKERFERPLSGVGNEIFKCMAAIAYCFGKEVFCFPWLSRERFLGYHGHLSGLLDILADLEKIVVLPVGE